MNCPSPSLSRLPLNEAHELMEKKKEEQHTLLKNTETMAADRGCDYTKFLTDLWATMKLNPSLVYEICGKTGNRLDCWMITKMSPMISKELFIATALLPENSEK